MMEVYFRAFVSWKQNNEAWLLLMAKLADNNANNASTDYIISKLNISYHSKVLFKENINSHSRSYSTDKLAEKLRELIEVCYQNLFYIQKLHKRLYNKGIKSCSYVLDEKVQLNSKYIKIKKNKKLKNKFFGIF